MMMSSFPRAAGLAQTQLTRILFDVGGGDEFLSSSWATASAAYLQTENNGLGDFLAVGGIPLPSLGGAMMRRLPIFSTASLRRFLGFAFFGFAAGSFSFAAAGLGERARMCGQTFRAQFDSTRRIPRWSSAGRHPCSSATPGSLRSVTASARAGSNLDHWCGFPPRLASPRWRVLIFRLSNDHSSQSCSPAAAPEVS